MTPDRYHFPEVGKNLKTKPYRMCVLHVTSLTDSFKGFLNDSKLPVYQSHEKGDERKSGRREILTYDDYGFSCDVSKKEWVDFEGQIQDIALFINKYQDELKELKENYSISDWRIDLPYDLRIGENYFSQSDYVPPNVLGLLGKFGIGLELSLYPPSDEKE